MFIACVASYESPFFIFVEYGTIFFIFVEYDTIFDKFDILICLT